MDVSTLRRRLGLVAVGASAFPRQPHVTRAWIPGEALLIDGSRLLPLYGSNEIVDVVRRR